MKIHCLYDRIIDIFELKPHPKNRNNHPKEQIERLAKILEYQGFRYPIKVSKRSGFITSGHGRLLAAKHNGWKEVPVNFQDYESDEQEYADVQADNAIASWSELDFSGINSDMADLGPDFDIELLGLKDFTVEVADKEALCDEDEVPEHVEPKTKLGDIYRLGEHRLMCGDSTSIDAVEKLLDGQKADMVFTDPPYLQETEGGGSIGEKTGRRKLSESGLNDFSVESIIATIELIDPESAYFFCSKKLIKSYIAMFDGMGRLWDLLVMSKKNPIPTKGGNYLNDIEWLFFSRKSGAFFNDKTDYENYYKVRQVSVKPSSFGHPTEKQVSFIEPYMEISCPKKGLVLDLFGGSGSTLIACEKTNRKCFIMELDPKYCDVIVARWEKYTGKKAELING